MLGRGRHAVLVLGLLGLAGVPAVAQDADSLPAADKTLQEAPDQGGSFQIGLSGGFFVFVPTVTVRATAVFAGPVGLDAALGIFVSGALGGTIGPAIALGQDCLVLCLVLKGGRAFHNIQYEGITSKSAYYGGFAVVGRLGRLDVALYVLEGGSFPAPHLEFGFFKTMGGR